MDQSVAPLFEGLLRFIDRSCGNYHVPGHKQGNAFDETGLTYFRSLLSIDLTEVGDLDDLHHAGGIIDEAQRLAAHAFSADKTFFLVGGTTAGNLATCLALCRPGEEMIIQRSSHLSVFNGCMLAGARPITLPVRMDTKTGCEAPLKPQQLERVLASYPTAKGVVLTSPSYFGVVQPIKELSAVCHEYNVPLVVDEAHGAHLGFHAHVPPSAMQCGADIAIQSTHKMLTSMTMSSMLHLKEGRVNENDLAQWLRTLQSSSPSYPMLASLDLARRYVIKHGKKRIHEVLVMLRKLREELSTLTHIYEYVSPHPQDPFKLTIMSKDKSVSGYTMQQWLQERELFPELATGYQVLFVFSLGTVEKHCEDLLSCLMQLDKVILHLPSAKQEKVSHFHYSQPILSFEKVRERSSRSIPLKDAIGSVVAEMVIPYPPGIPFLLPGEEITSVKKRSIEEILILGHKVRGITYKSSTPFICVLQ